MVQSKKTIVQNYLRSILHPLTKELLLAPICIALQGTHVIEKFAVSCGPANLHDS